MNKNGLPENEVAASGGSLRGWQLILIGVVALGAAGLYYWFTTDRGAPAEPAATGTVTVVPEGSRTVTLFFADHEKAVLLRENRQVAIGKTTVEQARQVIRELLAGPERDAVNAVPADTRLLGVFYDPESATLYLDFSGDLVAGHPGGSAAEYFTISAIMKTISENLADILAVQLLVEGSQVGTIGGHINAYRPFLVRDWR